jgi:hypothetical protein
MDQTGQEGMPNWMSADIFQFGKKRTEALLTMQRSLSMPLSKPVIHGFRA